MNHKPANNKAFTLIELLVVIAVIAVLLSILLPSLRLAKAQGKVILCRSNIRQLALSNLLYASENGEHFVAAAADLWDSSGGLQRWHGTRQTPNDPFDAAIGPLSSYLGDGLVKQCPENMAFHKGQGWNDSFEKGCGGYGYNLPYLGSIQWKSGIKTIDQWKQSYARTTKTVQVAQPSGTLMFADTAYLQNGNLIEYSFAEPRYWLMDGNPDMNASPIPTIHFRHKLKANIAWVDGHVGSLDIPKEYDSANAYLENFRQHFLGMVEPVDNTFFDLE